MDASAVRLWKHFLDVCVAQWVWFLGMGSFHCLVVLCLLSFRSCGRKKGGEEREREKKILLKKNVTNKMLSRYILTLC